MPHLKDMITSWADEEDKANAKYDAIRGMSKQNTGRGSSNNGNQGGRNNNNYSGPNRKRKPDNTVAAIQRPAKENPKKTSGGFKDFLKEKCPWHLDDNHTTEQCYQLRRALKGTPEPPHPHDKKGKKKNNEGNDDFQEPDKTVNVLFGGLPSRREQKATRREVMSIEPVVPTPLRWSEVPVVDGLVDGLGQWWMGWDSGRWCRLRDGWRVKLVDEDTRWYLSAGGSKLREDVRCNVVVADDVMELETIELVLELADF
jgi:hypothetical protein